MSLKPLTINLIMIGISGWTMMTFNIFLDEAGAEGRSIQLPLPAIKGKMSLEPGVYHYNPANYTIDLILKGDLQNSLAKACLGQMFIADAPLCIVNNVRPSC